MMPTYYQSFDTGETKTLDAWSQGYVLYTQADGSMVAYTKYSNGIPPLTLRPVDTPHQAYASEF